MTYVNSMPPEKNEIWIIMNSFSQECEDEILLLSNSGSYSLWTSLTLKIYFDVTNNCC